MIRDETAFLKDQIRDSRGPIFVCGVLMLIQSGAALTLPWLAGVLTSALTDGSAIDEPPLSLIFTALIGLFAAQAALGFGYGYLLAATREHLSARMRVQVHDHIQSLPLSHHNDRSTGDLLTLLAHDVEVVCNFVTGVIVPALPWLMTFAVALAMMWRTDWMLAGLAALSVPAFYLLSRRLNHEMRESSESLTRAQADALTAAEEHFRLIPLIKAYGREPTMSQRFRSLSRDAKILGMRQSVLLHRVQPLLEFLSITGLLSLLWLASRMTVNGQLSAAALVSFFLYGLMFARSMSSLASLYGQVQQTRVAVKRVVEILNSPGEGRNAGGIEIKRASGRIQFCDVCFAYPGHGTLFTDLRLEIQPGETVAITGPNGAGKTTLIKLLLRFYPLLGGEIRLDGTDISRLRLHALRQQIAWASQSVLLLGGSVYENIAFGRTGADRDAVEAAARAALADEFIENLPNGYNTIIGRDGLRLSGGQQQRIGLARALLRNAPILVLDEATVMFDPYAEARFLEMNRRLLDNRTVIIITHHEQSLKLADRIIRVEAGNAVDSSLQTAATLLSATGR